MNSGFSPWLYFILVLARILSFLVTAPVLSRRNVPTLAKLGLGFLLTLMVMPQGASYRGANGDFVTSLIAEVCVGLVAGVLTSWLFMAFQMGGQLMDQQAGFGTASILDPGTSTTVSLLSNLILYISILLFLELNGHHVLLLGMLRSFSLAPVGTVQLGSGLAMVAVHVLTATMVIFVRLAIPVLAVLIITDLTLGMVGRTVPQLNVLMLGLPVKAAVAMLVLGAVSPVFLGIGNSVISQIESTLVHLMGVIAP